MQRHTPAKRQWSSQANTSHSIRHAHYRWFPVLSIRWLLIVDQSTIRIFRSALCARVDDVFNFSIPNEFRDDAARATQSRYSSIAEAQSRTERNQGQTSGSACMHSCMLLPLKVNNDTGALHLHSSYSRPSQLSDRSALMIVWLTTPPTSSVGPIRSSAPVKGRTASTARLRIENVCTLCLARTG